MAKSQFYLFLLFLIPNLSSAQSDFKMLNSNNINAFIGNTGTLFYNTYTFSAGYEVPKGTGLHCMFGARLVFAGKNAQGNLFMSSGDYNQGFQDFFPDQFLLLVLLILRNTKQIGVTPFGVFVIRIFSSLYSGGAVKTVLLLPDAALLLRPPLRPCRPLIPGRRTAIPAWVKLII